MGLFDRDVESLLDEMFDLNRDGRIDFAEEALEFEYLEREIKAEELGVDASDLDDLDLDELQDLEDLRDLDLEDMDEDELRDALEDAGYDPEDFDS